MPVYVFIFKQMFAGNSIVLCCDRPLKICLTLIAVANDRQQASITWCDLFWPKFGQKMPKTISLHDVLEPSKQALLASRDVIISSQICGSNLQKVFTLGDGCWLPKTKPRKGTWAGLCEDKLSQLLRQCPQKNSLHTLGKECVPRCLCKVPC